MTTEGDWSVEASFACGDQRWRVRTLTLDERIGEPYVAALRLVTDAEVAPLGMLGKRCILTLVQGETERLVTGIVTRVEPLGRASGLVHARVKVEPRVALARRRRRWRIFQDLTVPQVVAEVLGTIEGVSVVARLQRSYEPREYCVQHGEHDLAFVSRLLEDEGISWTTDDDGANGEQVTLIDELDGFNHIEPVADLRVVAGLKGSRVPGVTSLLFSHRLPSPGVYERDWDWASDPPQVHETTLAVGDAPATWEVFETRRDSFLDLEQHARDELELHAVRDRVGRGDSDVVGIAAGRYFQLDVEDLDPLALLVAGVRHRAEFPESDQVASGGEMLAPSYANAFECHVLDAGFRPSRVTERPRVYGLQTAVVTGPPGEEIHTDRHGRIRVRMHWDRRADASELSSCWLRVAHAWGGAGWGTLFLPRVGMEVLVAFVDGDPDRPVCIGCVYNGSHHPPQMLPDERTRSTIRTRSSPGGNGFNELSFEDAASHEQVYLHAQRNFDEVVRANHSCEVGIDETIHVGRDRRTAIDRHEIHKVEKDSQRHVMGSQEVQVAGSHHMVVFGGPGAGEVAEPAAAGADLFVHGTYNVNVRDRILLQCGDSSIEMTPMSITMKTSVAIKIEVPGSAVTLVPGAITQQSSIIAASTAAGASVELGDEVAVSAPNKVKLAVAKSKLTLDPVSARLRSDAVDVRGKDSLELQSSAVATLDAPEVSVVGKTSTSIEGGGASVALEAGAVALNDA